MCFDFVQTSDRGPCNSIVTTYMRRTWLSAHDICNTKFANLVVRPHIHIEKRLYFGVMSIPDIVDRGCLSAVVMWSLRKGCYVKVGYAEFVMRSMVFEGAMWRAVM